MRKLKNNTDRKTERWTGVAKELKCSVCPPNKGENAKRQPKYGSKKAKHKTSKREGLIEHVCPPNCSRCKHE